MVVVWDYRVVVAKGNMVGNGWVGLVEGNILYQWVVVLVCWDLTFRCFLAQSGFPKGNRKWLYK